MRYNNVSLLAVSTTADEDSQEVIVVITNVTNTITMMFQHIQLAYFFILRLKGPKALTKKQDSSLWQ